MRFHPDQVGWRLGRGETPRCGDLWVPWDRTAGVIGPQGSGKTLDLLVPALLGAPGGALVTLTKVEDMTLTLSARSAQGPCVVLDPFGLAPGLPELIWDPVAGAEDPLVAERRAKAFTAGTVASSSGGGGDAAARFYAFEAAKVLMAFLHAAALVGDSMQEVLRWVANPVGEQRPREILRTHPYAAPDWYGLLEGSLTGDDRTAGNTVTTVQQAMALFFQPSILARCTPGPGREATDIPDIIRRGGTVYLLGREDPYASATPLMTAVAEHVLDMALAEANTSPHGRLCPPFLSCLDELPSTAPLPTLRTRMANERALGLAFIWAAQTRRQLEALYGQDEARALFGLTNVLVVFGGSKDVEFNKEVSELSGTFRNPHRQWSGKAFERAGHDLQDEAVFRPEDVRRIKNRHALVVAENARPVIAKLSRAVEGKAGQRLKADQAAWRRLLQESRASARGAGPTVESVRRAAAEHDLVSDGSRW